MSGPLCDAVLDRKGSALELASLEQESLFIVPLDRHRGAYRYHHLFRDLLRQELEDREPELVSVLNQRAADWFEAQGDDEATLDYAHAAGNENSAARILSSIAMPVSASGRVASVESWLDRFDEDALQRHPEVAVEGSRIHALRGRPEEAEAWLAAAERGVPANGKGANTRACIEVLHAAMCADGPESMLKRTTSALRKLPDDHPWRPWALVVNGTAHVLLGEDELADQVFAVAATGSTQPESHALALSERSLLAAGHDDERAEALALEAQRLIEDRELDAYSDGSARPGCHRPRAPAPRPLGRGAQAADSHAAAGALPHPRDPLALGAGPARARPRLRDPARPQRGARAGRRGSRDPRAAAGARRARRSRSPRSSRDRGHARGGRRRHSGLTRAELRLLPLLSTHLSFREIGERLFVSRNTIKTQAISVYRKLGVSSRSDAIARAAELGLVDAGTGSAALGPAGDVESAVLLAPRPAAARTPSGAACRRSSPTAARARRRR